MDGISSKENRPDLTDSQINALISSGQNSPNLTLLTTKEERVANNGAATTTNDVSENALDVTLFNMLSNDTTVVEETPLRKEVKIDTSQDILPVKNEVKRESIPAVLPESKLEKRVVKSETKEEVEDDDDGFSRISLYARLDFPNFTFYVQTLQVILGRKIDDDQDNSVDVHLGPTKAISRKHGKIFYNFGTQRFEFSILGRNGAFVDETFVETGVTLPLKNNTKIQIGEIPFNFVLPSPNSGIKKTARKQINPSDAINLKSSLYNTTSSTSNSPNRVSRENSITETTKKPVKEKPTKKVKQPKKVYTLEEIPEQYRTKPSCSYSHLIAVCLKERSTERGMSLSEIYKGIQDLYPYYYYCPDGWQSSVRHNLSLNKSFKKVSKEGKGWLWGLDEEFVAEKEKLANNNNLLKKPVIMTPQQQRSLNMVSKPVTQSTLKTSTTTPPLMSRSPYPPQGKSIAQLASEIKRPVQSTTTPLSTSSEYNYNKDRNIQAQLAANRSMSPKTNTQTPPPPSSSSSQMPATITKTLPPSLSSQSPPPLAGSKLSGDTMKLLNYLQQELTRLTKDRKGLDKKTTTQIITQALAMTISQVNQAAKSNGMLVTEKNPLVLLIDRDPQHLTKILTAALNAATYQVTKGKVKPGVTTNTTPKKTTPPPPKPQSQPPPSQQQQPVVRSYPQPQPGTNKPPINDKFRPPHVTNPLPQQLSKPPMMARPVPLAPVPANKPPAPKPAPFSKPSPYVSRPTGSPLLPSVSTLAMGKSNAPVNGIPKISKPSSYAAPLKPGDQRIEVPKPVIPVTMDDDDIDKVIESFSRQGTPDDNDEPVDLDKLLAEDGFLDEDRGLKRDLTGNDDDKQLKIPKIGN